MKKRESYKKHLNRGVMAVSFAVIFIVFSIMGGRIQAFADDAVATQTDAAKSNSSGPVTTGLAIDGYYGEWSQYPSADITYLAAVYLLYPISFQISDTFSITPSPYFSFTSLSFPRDSFAVNPGTTLKCKKYVRTFLCPPIL